MLHKFICSRAPILILFIIAYGLLSAYVMTRFTVASSMGDSYWRAQLGDMVAGKAMKPYVYRALVPTVAGLIVAATPSSVRGAVNDQLADLRGVDVVKGIMNARPAIKNAFANNVLYVRFIVMSLVYGCLIGYIILLYKMGDYFYPQSWAMALASPVVGLIMIPGFTYPTMYIYDFAVLFLSAACFYTMALQRWRGYLFCFFLATLNKETSFFIFVFFTLWYLPRLDTPRYIRLWSAQAAIFLAIKTALWINFIGNAGVFLESYQDWQIGLALEGYNYRFLMVIFMMYFLLVFRWQEKPLFARYVLWLMPMMYLAYIMYGFPNEFRVFFDLFPLLVILVTHTLVEGTGIAKSPVFHRSPFRQKSYAAVV